MNKRYDLVIPLPMFLLLALSIALMALPAGAALYQLVDSPEPTVIRPVLHTGTPPVATPVLLHWIRPDGTVHSESAEYFEGIGMLPFSTTGSAVPYDIMQGWAAWVELDPRIGGLDGRL